MNALDRIYEENGNGTLIEGDIYPLWYTVYIGNKPSEFPQDGWEQYAQRDVPLGNVRYRNGNHTIEIKCEFERAYVIENGPDKPSCTIECVYWESAKTMFDMLVQRHWLGIDFS